MCVFVQSRRRKDEKTEAFPLYFFGLPNYENAALTLNNTPSAVCKRLLEYACLRVYITCLLWAEYTLFRIRRSRKRGQGKKREAKKMKKNEFKGC